MNVITFILGLLSGCVLAFVFVGILLRQGKARQADEISDINRRSLEALIERNRISQLQLEVMRRDSREK